MATAATGARGLSATAVFRKARERFGPRRTSCRLSLRLSLLGSLRLARPKRLSARLSSTGKPERPKAPWVRERLRPASALPCS
eukprot:4502318-Alexandrium_andersonii.AAC.1